MLTFLLLIVIFCILFFLGRKLIRQRLIIDELERKLKRQPVNKKKEEG